MGAEPFPLERSGEQAVFREDGDMLRSTAGGVGVSDLSCRTPADIHTSVLFSAITVLYVLLFWFVYLCVERQETLERWLQSRRLPSAAAPPPCREWERAWEWAEIWRLCPAHWPTPSALLGPVARLRTAWRHAVRSLQPSQTDTESI